MVRTGVPERRGPSRRRADTLRPSAGAAARPQLRTHLALTEGLEALVSAMGRLGAQSRGLTPAARVRSLVPESAPAPGVPDRSDFRRPCDTGRIMRLRTARASPRRFDEARSPVPQRACHALGWLRSCSTRATTRAKRPWPLVSRSTSASWTRSTRIIVSQAVSASAVPTRPGGRTSRGWPLLATRKRRGADRRSAQLRLTVLGLSASFGADSGSQERVRPRQPGVRRLEGVNLWPWPRQPAWRSLRPRWPACDGPSASYRSSRRVQSCRPVVLAAWHDPCQDAPSGWSGA